jgi:hypothetical protein
MSKNPFTNFTNEARRARAVEAAGVTSLSGIAAALNARGIPTASGSGRWYHAQVRRLLARLAA